MRPGQASRTAVMVCAGRALAHGRSGVARFEDPTALALLPADVRAQVERLRAGRPAGFGERITRVFRERQARMMVARTVAIDDAIRDAPAPALVILGAGLDGRAYRMSELRDADVFEVDHPDSQADKRARLGALEQAARAVHFVPVDFTRDDLETALDAAGHDASRPTTWIWEGVVMYLDQPAIEATLAVVARRSAPKSRLVVLYHQPALILRVIGLRLRAVGEPLRSVFKPASMRALLGRFGFAVTRDVGVDEIGATLDPALGRALRVIKHLRVVVADR